MKPKLNCWNYNKLCGKTLLAGLSLECNHARFSGDTCRRVAKSFLASMRAASVLGLPYISINTTNVRVSSAANPKKEASIIIPVVII